MTILTVAARGQVTLRKDVLQHLGIKPGGKDRARFTAIWPRHTQSRPAYRND